MEGEYIDKLKMAEFSKNTAILRELSKEDDSFLRSVVAQNKSLPASLFKKLSCDEDINVRLAVAENNFAPFYILEELSKDENQDIFEAVYLNGNTDKKTLIKIEQGSRELSEKIVEYRKKIFSTENNSSYH